MFRPQLSFERTPATLIIMATVAALELISALKGGTTRNYYYDIWFGLTPDVWNWQLWRPFTTTILHGGLWHAFFNLYWLSLFGAILEDWWGPVKYTAGIVFVATATAMIQFVLPDVRQSWQAVGVRGAVGLSGVMYGMLGFLIVARRRFTELHTVCPPQTSRFLIAWAVICIPLTYMRFFHIANLAHFSGLGIGYLIGEALYARNARKLWRAGLVAVAAITITLMFYAPWAPGYQLMRDNPEAWQQSLRKEYPKAFD